MKPEIFAYGLRNPWRFGFDGVSKLLWVGDVGQNNFEEISIVQSGDNLGWNIREGFSCYQSDHCDKKGLKDPLIQIPSDSARSITGGYVYRGKKASPYYGVYIFGDYVKETLWGLTQNQGKKKDFAVLGQAPDAIASFGQDRAKNLYMVCFDGRIYKFNF